MDKKYLFLIALLPLFGGAPTAVAQEGSIKGIVTTTSGQPLSGAVVVLSSAGDASLQQQQRISDRDGGFLFSDLFSGTYQLTVTSLGYQQASVRVEVPQASPLTVTLTQSADELQAVEIVG